MNTKILLAIVLVALMMSCSTEFSDDDFLVGPPESFDDLMSQGWSAFETENYGIAVETFAAAAERKATLPEVYLGLGWSNIRDLNLENGRIYLGSAISFAFLDVENGAQIILDAQSGLAGIALAEGDYDSAIDYVDQVLSSQPAYVFSHDTRVDLDALKRIRMTAAYFQGDYADAFQEIVDLGIAMDNVSHEMPVSGSMTTVTVVDSGTTLAGIGELTANWVKVTASGHGLVAGDYTVLSGLSDGGDANLTTLVGSLTRSSGWKLTHIVDADNFLVSSVSNDDAALISSITVSSGKYFEGTGVAVATDGSGMSGVIGVNVYNGRQLVHVNSVSALVDDGAVYSVNSVEEGGTGIEIFGNPVFEVGQRVAVDYYHTDNFGLFLSELIELVSNI